MVSGLQDAVLEPPHFSILQPCRRRALPRRFGRLVFMVENATDEGGLTWH